MTIIISKLKSFVFKIMFETKNDIKNTLLDYVIQGEIQTNKSQPVFGRYSKLFKQDQFIIALLNLRQNNELKEFLLFQINSVSEKTQISVNELISIYIDKIEKELDKQTNEKSKTWNSNLNRAKTILINILNNSINNELDITRYELQYSKDQQTIGEIDDYKPEIELCQEFQVLAKKIGAVKHGDASKVREAIADILNIPLVIRKELNLNDKNGGNSSQKLTPSEFKYTRIYKIIDSKPFNNQGSKKIN